MKKFIKNLIKKLEPEQWADILKTIASVVIAGIFGTIITHHYKILDQQQTSFQTAKDEATKTYYTLIDKLGNRHFFAMQAAIGYQWNLDDAKDRMDRYENSVREWNLTRYSTLALAQRYFGDQTKDKIYALIKKFNHIHQKLIAVKNKRNDLNIIDMPNMVMSMQQPNIDLSDTLKEIWQLDDDISTFSDELQSQLKEGKVDIYSPVPPLNKPK